MVIGLPSRGESWRDRSRFHSRDDVANREQDADDGEHDHLEALNPAFSLSHDD
jgi:hypothetical protein